MTPVNPRTHACGVRIPQGLDLDFGLNLDALTDDRTANLIEAAYVLNGYQLKWASVSLADLDPLTINDRVDVMKVIADQMQWIQT